MQAVADLGEPPGENADKLITELVRGFTAPTNEHRLKDSQKRFQNKLAEQVELARMNARNSARRLDMQTFNTCLMKVMSVYERHHAETAEYGLIAKPTSSSSRDDKKAKSGDSKPKSGTDVVCSGCGGWRHTANKCYLKEHPDFNKQGPWDKSAAYAKLKAKHPDDESKHHLDRRNRADGTPLAKPIERPEGVSKYKGDKSRGTTVPTWTDAPTTSMVAAASAAADDTMYRTCVISTNASNCRIVKVLFDTGSSPFNFVREEVAAWIEAEERKLPSECHLSMEDRRQSTTVNLAGSGDHTVVSSKTVVCNLLFFNEVKKSTELLPCLVARTIASSIDMIVGLPAIRKHDLVSKIPSHFTSNQTDDRYAEIFPGTSCSPTGVNLFGLGNRPPGNSELCATCCFASGGNKTHSELNSRSELNSGSKVKSENFSKFLGAKQRNRSRSFAGQRWLRKRSLCNDTEAA